MEESTVNIVPYFQPFIYACVYAYMHLCDIHAHPDMCVQSFICIYRESLCLSEFIVYREQYLILLNTLGNILSVTYCPIRI